MTTTTTTTVPRSIKVAAAQLGPNQKDASRASILDRMLKLMDEAAAKGVRILAYPELALTTFFPVHYMTDEDQIAQYFEPTSAADPYGVLSTPHAKPLVDKANELGIDFYLGFAERWTGDDGKKTDFNTCIYYSVAARRGVGKYRKVHLPGRKEPLPDPKAFQQLEKKYFTPGDLGFQAFRAPGLIENALKLEDVGTETESFGKGDPILGMLICNDRRWPEAWRPYGLQVCYLGSRISDILIGDSRARNWSSRDITPLLGRRNTKERLKSSKSLRNSTIASHAKLEATRTPSGASMSPSVALKMGRASSGAV
jgi:predicted amidohydrolase